MRRVSWIAAAVLLGSAVTVAAQKTTNVHPGKGGSPHVRTEWVIDGANVSIEYGRPSLKGRTPGKDVDPYEGREWRTGADEATTLKTDKPLQIGTLSVPAGTYTLYTLPGEPWQLIVNKQTGQWGTSYNEAQDLGRVPMTASKLDKPVEQLTITIAGGNLEIHWADTKQSVAIK